ncbi:polymorphic toxin-type HINT domain-containing protein [Streptomyces sp. NPDC048197]|uniref:polymorphic toxin-type HINT domain-containing protein n=1 Tax=Streptomyces sp. NPDC048197 TaxID=3365511 RepID=UPI0037242727
MANSMAAGALMGGGEGPGARMGLRGGRGGPCHSFLPATEVALADGQKKKIEDVKTGDQVIATDPATGKTTTRPVVATIVTKDDKHFTDLTVKTPTGDSSIIATDTHPFWSADKKKWINAGDLRPGTQLRTPQGTIAEIIAVRHFHKKQQTHDLTLAGTHTYYVLAGATPVLVHNCNRAGLDFTDAERQKVYDANSAKNGGEYQCDYCGQTVERRASRDANGNAIKGRPDDAQIDHVEPRASGGHGGAHNGAVACRRCNRDKSTKTMEDWDDELRDFLGP